MPVNDLGNKHVCFKCSTKFYDMKKPDPVCPKCGANQRDSPAPKAESTKKSRLAAAKVIEPTPEPEEAEASEDEEGEAFEDEDAEPAAEDEEEI